MRLRHSFLLFLKKLAIIFEKVYFDLSSGDIYIAILGDILVLNLSKGKLVDVFLDLGDGLSYNADTGTLAIEL